MSHDRHRLQPVGVRVDLATRDWLAEYADDKGVTVHAVMLQAVEEYRRRRDPVYRRAREADERRAARAHSAQLAAGE